MHYTTTLRRIRTEYLEMPGLRLTIQQAQRLCDVEHQLCQQVLDTLVNEKFLCVTRAGAYARSSELEFRPYPAKAELSGVKRASKAS